MSIHKPSYDLRLCDLAIVRDLCARYHGYGGAGAVATYAFAVYENDIPIAAYSWQPPAPGAARNVCPAEPSAVLALSRMVAVPREERQLNHVSRPLRRQMVHLIDRTRYPILVTYSDEGQGHTGHVYKCSGWHPTRREQRRWYYRLDGSRVSSYSSGRTSREGRFYGGLTWIQRWEHHVCEPSLAAEYMAAHGWVRVPVPGKLWRSGNQAYTWAPLSGR